MLTHVDLFSGIGGFALAAGWAGFRTVSFCEIDGFCQEVLKKHWPDVPVFGDIHGFQWTGRSPSLLTGGFPCQPFSFAGKRKGQEDDRALWPQMRRVITESRPCWVVAENVIGIVGMGLDQVLSDLGDDDYSAEAIVIPACALDAVHARARVWVVANSKRNGVQGREALREGWETHPRDEQLAGLLLSGSRATLPIARAYRVHHGIPGQMDRNRSLGNAIVPQVAYQIIRAIAEIERGNAMKDCGGAGEVEVGE